VSITITRAAGEDLAAVCGIAHDEGPAPALGELQRILMPDALVCGATGWAIVPATAGTSTTAVVIGDQRFIAEETSITPLRTPALRARELTAVHARPGDDADPEPAPGAAAAVSLMSGHLRLGLATRLREAALLHLRDRTSAGVPLLQQQAVKSTFADAALDLLLARRQLELAELEERAAVRAHVRLTRAGRTLLSLLGASGYLLTGAGADAHVSEMTANVFAAGAAHAEAAP
jgi:hypothetical protein